MCSAEGSSGGLSKSGLSLVSAVSEVLSAVIQRISIVLLGGNSPEIRH